MPDVESTPATRPRTDASELGLPPTATLGRYRLLGLLGRGGMGVVYSGFDDQLRRRVAIKRINRRGADELSRQRSLREAQAMACLAHPNIVTVYEAFEVDTQLCIVMEFVAGRTLREWLADVRPPRGEILAALMQAGRGVAAAHEAGLVHRDLKPDNIMIDEDGRVRVMDFGLARVADGRQRSREFEVTDTGPGDLSSGPAPYTALIGTPGYVAPEQDLGINADARSDVFSFCALAFEALHGRRPFAGRNDTELLVAVVAGRIEEGEDSGVPAWLDAVIRRGLAAEPDERWPTMNALLAALAADPLARRRRRLRAAVLFALAGVLVAVAMSVASAVREAGDRARDDAAAMARLRAVEATIDRAEAMGDAATAEAAFRSFVADPENRRTRALTRAWLTRGDRTGTDAAAAEAAYAEAYVHAHTPEDERESLRRLSGAFVRQWSGVGLARSVDLLRARGADDLALAELGFHAALWQRDLPAAAAELAYAGHPSAAWRSTLDHLSRSTASGHDVGRLEVLPGAGPARIAIRDPDSTQVVVLDAGLTEVGRWREQASIELVPRTSWALAQTASEARLFDLLTGAVVGRTAPWIAPFAPFDATGDGAPELFFGRAWPRYGFLRWDDLGRAGAHVRDAHPGTDASGSTFETHVVGDLDGDGADELVIGFGPWHRFDLRVFRPDARGELELVAERPLGRIGDLALVRRGPRRLLAALIDNSCPAPELFPEPPHTGRPPGVYFFEWADDDLVEVDFVALPHDDTFGQFTGRDSGAVGDLDGDGAEDLAFALDRGTGPWLMMLRQTESGFSPLLLSGVKLHAGAQLDGDVPLELLTTRAPSTELLVLGLGDRPTPRISQTAPEPPPLPESLRADPWLVERWNRASDLTSLTLLDTAAASLRDAALMVVDRPAKSSLLDRAGELFASRDRMFEVLALEHDIHDDPAVRDRARLRRAQALSRVGRHEDALAEAEALLRTPAGAAEPLRVASALVNDLSALLAPDARLDVDFAVALAPQWRIHTPGALRRGPARSGLNLAIPATSAPVAELPLEWEGGPISLEFELDIERLEFGAGVELTITDASGQQWLGGALCGQGGGGRLQQVVWLKAGGAWTLHSEHAVPSGSRSRRIHLLMTYFPARGYVDMIVTNDGEVRLGRLPVATPPEPGPLRLVIGSFVDSNQSSLVVGDLRRLVLRGVHLASPSAEDLARDRPAQLLAESEPRAALAALSGSPHPRGEALRLLALAELGDLDGITLAASDVLAHADDPQWLGDFTLALRRHPLAAAALRDAGGPALLPVLGSVWAFARPHRNDPSIRGEILDALREIERLAPRTDTERDALRGLLETRAELWQRSGQSVRAAHDSEAAALLGSQSSQQ